MAPGLTDSLRIPTSCTPQLQVAFPDDVLHCPLMPSAAIVIGETLYVDGGIISSTGGLSTSDEESLQVVPSMDFALGSWP